MYITDVPEKLAITMWDSSWIRRRYAGGGFEDFDTALDELKERGYNAVRIDAFPHLIASSPAGVIQERFLDTPGVSHHKYGFAQWGNQWTVYIYPRRDIVDFIRKCKARNIYVALSTWLKPTWEHWNDLIEGPQDLIRVWDETLTYLEEQDCLDNIIYVDVHNEIPLGACNTWLNNQLACMVNPVTNGMNSRQKAFYRDYFNTVLHTLKQKWHQLSFTASMTYELLLDENDMPDFSEFDLFDVHIWAEGCGFLKGTGYSENIVAFGNPDRIYLNGSSNSYVGSDKKIPGDFYMEETNIKILEAWEKNKAHCTEWLQGKIRQVAELGRKYGVPYGNTEGWGSIFWVEHPMLTWDVSKQSGLIAAGLASDNGYLFCCQSNFCEPQYLRLWRDGDYHRQVTQLIRK